MWTESKIIEIFSNIMKMLTGIEFERQTELKTEKLLGGRINLKARDLLVVLDNIENAFSVSISEESICDGQFDTYDHILELLFQSLVK